MASVVAVFAAQLLRDVEVVGRDLGGSRPRRRRVPWSVAAASRAAVRRRRVGAPAGPAAAKMPGC